MTPGEARDGLIMLESVRMVCGRSLPDATGRTAAPNLRRYRRRQARSQDQRSAIDAK